MVPRYTRRPVKSTVEPLEGNKVKLSVEVDEAEFDRDIDAAFRKIAHEVRLPGFRPGKAPRRILEARIGLAPAREQALQDAIPSYLADAVGSTTSTSSPRPRSTSPPARRTGPSPSTPPSRCGPTVIVPGYAGLRVELPSVAVTDEEVDERGRRRAASPRRAGSTSTGRPSPGDFVTLDLAAEPRRRARPRAQRRGLALRGRAGAGSRPTSTTT